ncbi:hypothetical protein QFZ82_003243 [Streptomyces sp. V4I23]|nr:hypothetical protein [Streptomyces sp. V4I23]MDQ1008758.1 hypothetical protein [Streptomyces sp. V4I23]
MRRQLGERRHEEEEDQSRGVEERRGAVGQQHRPVEEHARFEQGMRCALLGHRQGGQKHGSGSEETEHRGGEPSGVRALGDREEEGHQGEREQDGARHVLGFLPARCVVGDPPGHQQEGHRDDAGEHGEHPPP